MPGRVIALGLWAGWIAALLFGRIVPLHFEVRQPADGIFSGLALAGYPKQQDWFRYALGLVAGPIGAILAALAWRGDVLAKLQPSTLQLCKYVPFALAIATVGAFLNADAGPAIALFLLPVAVILPWLDRGWYAEAAAAPVIGEIRPRLDLPVLIIIPLVALGWVFDSCLLFRSLDGFHEGPRLLYLQSFQAGEVPGLEVRTDYGPLLVHSLWWWCHAFGFTFAAYRWWFLAAQAAGLALTLFALRRIVRSGIAFGVAAVAVGGLSSVAAVQYGVPNALRLALPMAALAFSDLPVVSGIWLGLALLFSPEYGMAAAVAWAIAGLVGRRPLRSWATTCVATLGTLALLLGIMFGSRWPAGLAALGGGYGTARLLGHGAMRLPEFPWIGSPGGIVHDLDEWRVQILLWGPGLMAAAAAVRAALCGRTRDDAVAGWAVFVVLASIPVIARPAGQQANLVPAAAALAAILVDRGLAGGGRRAAQAAAGFMVLLTAQSFRPITRPMVEKLWLCGAPWSGAGEPVDGLERLGGVRLDPAVLPATRRAVEALRRWCPAGGRVYLAAPRYAHVPFLAGRAALGPFPLITVAATSGDRAAVVRALESVRPAVALVTADGLDVPWAVEHAGERAVILRDYRRVETIGDLEVWVRRR